MRNEAVEKVRSAAIGLRKAHAQALGAIQKNLETIQAQKAQSESKLEKQQSKEFAIAKTKASNVVLASHHRAMNATSGLFSHEGEKRCAEYLEIGEILVNAKNSGLSNELTIPMVIPFLGHENIFLKGAQELTDEMVRNILIESIINTDLADLSLYVFDPKIRNALASFSDLDEIRNGLFEVSHTDKELQETLNETRDRITRLANLTKGISGSIVDYVASAGTLPEPYKVMAFLDYPMGVSEQTHQQLLPIIESANDAGISCVFQLTDSVNYPDWFDEKMLADLGTSFDMSPGRTIWSGDRTLNIAVPQISQNEIVNRLNDYADSAQKALAVDLADIISDSGWKESSAQGITFAFAGKDKRRLEVTMGDALVHGLITGATGEGKSNLIKVLIYDLAARYSPDELQLMLLDFKEGVTLAPLAPSPGSPEFLPHARVLGLEADQEYGLSVLYEIEKIYKQRMAKMKPFDNIKAYRAANPEVSMPRILVVIDEFQGLLAEDEERIGQAASKKLLDLVRTVRAAGIHFILASQEIGSISSLVGKRDGLLSQVKLRVGLRNTPKEAMQTFEMGNDAAAKLKTKGEVVINEMFGDADGNVIGRVPFAPDDELSRLRTRWWEATRETSIPPMVFEGSKLASLKEDWKHLDLSTGISDTLRIPLGHPITVSQQPVTFDFDRIPGKNIALVGSATDLDLVDNTVESVGHPLATIEAIWLSIGRQIKNQNAQFVVIDLLSSQEKRISRFDRWLAEPSPQVIHQAEVQQWLAETYESMANRTYDSSPLFVIGLGMDRIGSLDVKCEGTTKRVSQVIRELWEQGPSVGIHCINWWSSADTFLTHVNRQVEKYFTGVMLYAGTNSISKRIIGPTSLWNGADKRVVYRDYSSASNALKLIPYAFSSAEPNQSVMSNDRL